MRINICQNDLERFLQCVNLDEKCDLYQRLQKKNKQVFLIYTVEKNDKKSKKKVNNYILIKLSNLNIDNFYNLENILDRDIYFYDSVHYSKQGHKKVSEKILSLL